MLLKYFSGTLSFPILVGAHFREGGFGPGGGGGGGVLP